MSAMLNSAILITVGILLTLAAALLVLGAVTSGVQLPR
jgi:hypothetical protein